MTPTVIVRLARSRQEFEDAFALIQRARREQGFTDGQNDIWLLKHHALPCTNTVVALQAGQVIAAVCLFGESAYRLPMEERLNLSSFRENLEGRMAELSVPAFHPGHARDDNLKLALFHFAFCFGATCCNYEGMVTEVSQNWAREHASLLQFDTIFEPINGKLVLFLNAREGRDFRALISKEYSAEFHFPEKKFFLVAHQSMEPATLDYLFNERTKLFASLSDPDLRVLKNIYDYGDYGRVLPSRSLVMPEKKSPRYPRFAMNCEGYMLTEKGQRVNVQVLDVSREGLKVRTSNPLAKGSTFMLTLFVGVNKKTELIANGVWLDNGSDIAGLEVKSHDQSWTQLIEYLEKDFLKAA